MGMKMIEIPREKADNLFSGFFYQNEQGKYFPRGLYFVRYEDESCTGIDNSTGDAWTEDFEDMDECRKWLIGVPEEGY